MDVVRIACTTGELIISNYTGARGLVYSPGEIHQLVKGTSDGNCKKREKFLVYSPGEKHQLVKGTSEGNCKKPEKFLVPRTKKTGSKRNRKKK